VKDDAFLSHVCTHCLFIIKKREKNWNKCPWEENLLERQKEQKKRTEDVEFYMDQMEEEKKKDDGFYINADKNVFSSRFYSGLNSRPSVFDATAIFQTGAGTPTDRRKEEDR